MRLVALLAVLLLVACGSEEAEPGGSSPRELEFTGYLFRAGGETRICDAIAESYPPQCGGESYRVAGLDVAAIDGLQIAQGVTWTDRPVTLRGVLSDDGTTLMVSANPAVRGDPPPPTGAAPPGSATD